jgi:hypothetical protein
MTLRVVGAGLPRTGTTSLKGALERLLGAPCYHMIELMDRFEQAPTWRDAVCGRSPDWDTFLAGYAAAVDWPAAWLWRELAAANPDAVVLLSQRDSREAWFHSMDKTVLARVREIRADRAGPAGDSEGVIPPFMAAATPEQRLAFGEMFELIGDAAFPDPDDPDAVMALYDRHLAEVRAEIPADRLLEWRPGDDWEPLCAVLGVPVPGEPFPHRNTTAEFHAIAAGYQPRPPGG